MAISGSAFLAFAAGVTGVKIAGDVIETTTKATAAATAGSAKLASEAHRVCYTCKQDLPSAWIAGRISSLEEKEKEEVDRNPHYVQSSGEFKTIYILEGKKPEEVYANGANYHLSEEGTPNQKGCVYFFHDLDHAKLCLLSRSDGKKYHPELGFRRDHDWKQQEINHIMQKLNDNKARPHLQSR
jgi:hypothetical protein